MLRLTVWLLVRVNVLAGRKRHIDGALGLGCQARRTGRPRNRKISAHRNSDAGKDDGLVVRQRKRFCRTGCAHRLCRVSGVGWGQRGRQNSRPREQHRLRAIGRIVEEYERSRQFGQHVGLKVTFTLHFAPTARVVPHVLD